MGDEIVSVLHDTNTDSDNTNDGVPGLSSSKKKRSAHRFAVQYDKSLEETYKWIRPDPIDRFKAVCKLCTKSFRAETSDIKRHALTAKHQAKIKACAPSAQKSVVDMFNKKSTPLEDKVKHAEMKLGGYFAAHDEPFSRMDHLVEVLKDMFPDSDIAKSLAIKRTKIKGLIINVIGDDEKEVLSEKLRKSKFSILTDESTDIACVKTACIMVRFYDETQGHIVSRFWELEQVFSDNDPAGAEEGATAARLYEAMITTFKTKNIPIDNIIGFASDGCNVMMGNTNSVKTRMMELCPGIRIVKCICHSLHLCASEACKGLPRTCEDLARNCYNFLKNSSKRQAQFAQFQKFFQLDVLKLLHPSQTRWLSLAAVIDRMLEMWEPLKLFFADKCLTEHLRISEDIYRALCDPFVKAYYLFLQWILPKFTRLNEYFHSEKTVVTVVHERMTTTYTEFLMMYMKSDYVYQTPVSDIQPDDSSKFLDRNQIYLGVAIMRQISTSEAMQRPDIIADFRMKCQNFLITSCLQMKARYDFGDPVLTQLPLLSPRQALSQKTREQSPSLSPLAMLLIRCTDQSDENLQSIDDEWRRLPIIKHTLPTDILTSTEADHFWHKIGQHKDEIGERLFIHLPEFALAALSVPISNADCERKFSKINNIKTDKRNRLITPTVNGVLLADQAVRKNEGCCKNFKASQNMLSKMTAKQIYNFPKTEVGESDNADDVFSFE